MKPGKRVNCTSEAFPVQHEREMSQLTWSEAWLGKELSLKVSHYIYLHIEYDIHIQLYTMICNMIHILHYTN